MAAGAGLVWAEGGVELITHNVQIGAAFRDAPAADARPCTTSEWRA